MKSLPLTLTDFVLFPVRLLVITCLNGTVFRLAEAEDHITCQGDTFTALEGAEISAVQHTLGGGMPSMKITFAHSQEGTFKTSDIANRFFDGAAVQLYVADRGPMLSIPGTWLSNINNLPGVKGLLFSGTIQAVAYGINGQGSFDIRGPVAQSASIIQTYGPMCRTDLFSSLCTVNPASYAQHGTIGSTPDKFTAIIAGLSSPPADGWFNLGVGVTASGVRFEIANWIQSTLTLTTFLPRCTLFTVGEAVTLYPGCDKTIGTCKSKFSNNLNHQGEPHFPGQAAASAGA